MRALAFAVLMLAASPAHADWLSDAWTPETVAATGGPAITLEADGSVILVLPVVTLKAALNSGLSVPDAARLFLERYGQHCVDALDLNEPHPNLPVALSLERPAKGDGIDLGGILLPDHLFVTDEEEARFTVDYVPTRKVVCVVPEVPVS